MKRDPRLKRSGERRAERRLHGLRLTDGYRAAQRIAAAFDLSFRPSYFKRMTQAAQAHERAQAQLIAHLRKTADIVAADLTRQLRRDFALGGEAHAHCDWDVEADLPTVVRVPPEDITVSYLDASGTERKFTPTDAQLSLIREGVTGGVSLDDVVRRVGDWQPPS